MIKDSTMELDSFIAYEEWRLARFREWRKAQDPPPRPLRLDEWRDYYDIWRLDGEP